MGLNDYLVEFCKKHGFTGTLSMNDDTNEYIIRIEGDLECNESTLLKDEYESITESQIKELFDLMKKGIEVRTRERK